MTALIEVVKKEPRPCAKALSCYSTLILLLQRTGYKQQLGVVFNRFSAIIANDFNRNVSIWVIRYYIAALFGGQEMEAEL